MWPHKSKKKIEDDLASAKSINMPNLVLDFVKYTKETYSYDYAEVYYFPVGFDGDFSVVETAVECIEEKCGHDDLEQAIKNRINNLKTFSVDFYVGKLVRSYNSYYHHRYIIFYLPRKEFDGYCLIVPDYYNHFDTFYSYSLDEFWHKSLNAGSYFKYFKNKEKEGIEHCTELKLYKSDYEYPVFSLFKEIKQVEGNPRYYELIIKTQSSEHPIRNVTPYDLLTLEIKYKGLLLKTYSTHQCDTKKFAEFTTIVNEFLFPFNLTKEKLDELEIDLEVTPEFFQKDMTDLLTLHRMIHI